MESLDELELDLLLYIINVYEPIKSPDFEITNPNDLLWIHHNDLLMKLSRNESKLTDGGKEVFKSLMTKLNRTPEQEREDYENTTKPELTQSEFQF